MLSPAFDCKYTNFFDMNAFLKLLKNIFSKEPFEQEIEVSISLEAVLFFVAFVILLLWILIR